MVILAARIFDKIQASKHEIISSFNDMIRRQVISFNGFMIKLNEYIMQFMTIKFADAFLSEHLTTRELTQVLTSKHYDTLTGNPKINNENPFHISGQMVIDMINTMCEYKNHDYLTGCKNLQILNCHWNRTRLINAFYEIILNYLEGLDKVKRKKASDILLSKTGLRFRSFKK